MNESTRPFEETDLSSRGRGETFPTSPSPGELVREKSICLLPLQQILIEPTAWRCAYVQVLRGAVLWSAREGVTEHDQLLGTGETVEIFTYGKHSFRAKGSGCELRLFLVEPRTFSELPFANPESPKLPSLGETGLGRGELENALRTVARFSIRTDLPTFMNQLFSGRTFESAKAWQLAFDLRTTLATKEAAPSLSAIESEVANALSKLCQWPATSVGIGVPGGTLGNFMGLHLARQRKFPEIAQTGASTKRLGVFASDQSHYSLEKAMAALGLGRDNLIKVRSEDGSMLTSALGQAIANYQNAGGIPLAVVATAGTTVLGAFDPLVPISKICEDFDLWLHVDGAWGGPALFSNEQRRKLSGIEKADSFSIDVHKLLGAPLTASMLLTRHREVLLQANAANGGAYLFHDSEAVSDDIDLGLMTWQCGRGPEALQFWTLWQSLGRRGIGDFIDRLILLRDVVVKRVEKEKRLSLVHRPQFLNVCVQVSPPSHRATVSPSDWTLHVRKRLIDSGKAFINFARGSNGAFLRLVLANPHLNEEILERLVEQILEVS